MIGKILNTLEEIPDLEIVIWIMIEVFVLIYLMFMYLSERAIKRLNEKFNQEHPEVAKVFNSIHRKYTE